MPKSLRSQETIGNLIEVLPTLSLVILGVRPPIHFKNPQRQIARRPKCQSGRVNGKVVDFCLGLA